MKFLYDLSQIKQGDTGLKKLFSTLIAILVSICLGSTVSANSYEEDSNSNIKVIEEGDSTFIYEYNGIESKK